MLRLEQRRADSLRRRSFEPPIIAPDQLSQQRASQAVFCPSPGCADNQGLRLLRQVLDPAEGRERGRHARLRLTSGAGGRDWETTLACLNRIGVGLNPFGVKTRGYRYRDSVLINTTYVSLLVENAAVATAVISVINQPRSLNLK